MFTSRALVAAARAGCAASSSLQRTSVRFISSSSHVQSAASSSDGLEHFKAAAANTARIEGVTDAGMEARPISKVAVVGGGLMGSGISTSLLVTGHSVLVREIDEAQCNAAKDRIVGNLKRSVKGGRMTEAEAETCISNLSTTTTFEPMADRDLVIESVIEKMDIKQSVFQAVADVVDEDCVMATNTSTMDITEISKGVANPGRVIGMHYFSPAHIMPLLEIVATPTTSKQTQLDILQLASRTRKTPVVVGNCPGFAVNRMWSFYAQAAKFLVDCSVDPCHLDSVICGLGLAMGPFAMQDMAGGDVCLNADRVILSAFEDRAYRSPSTQAFVDAGRIGQKAGGGYYEVDPATKRSIITATMGPNTLELVQHARQLAAAASPAVAAAHAAGRSFSDEEIEHMCMFPLISEGFRIIGEGMARSEEDLDVAACLGYGFPTARGGVMHYGRTQVDGGLATVVASLRQWQQEFGLPLFDVSDELLAQASGE